MLRIYLAEAKFEFLKYLRMPIYVISTLAFPLMFYVFFGLTMGQKASGGAPPMARYLLATYGAFGVIGISLFGFGAGIAVERGLGWLQVKRASPMPPAAYFFAKTASCLLFSTVLVALLFTLGAAAGGVRMPVERWLLLAATLVAGAIPFCAMGMALGYYARPNSAPAVVNALYLPMAFCSGLWIPLPHLPKMMQAAAPLLPPFHFSQLALAALGAAPQADIIQHVQALAGFTLLFAGVAWFGQRREQEKMYG